MFLLFHVFTALIVGIILAILLKNNWFIFWCAGGGFLLDFIDKIFGHFAFYEVVGATYRLYTHTILFIVLLFAIGTVLYIKNKKHVALLGLGAGGLVHQIGDAMWNMSQTWFWPFVGNLLNPKDVAVIASSGKTILILICLAEVVLYAVLYFTIINRKRIKIQLLSAVLFVVAEAITIIVGLLILHGGDTSFVSGTSNWLYAFKIVEQETSLMSEWVFGFVSLAILLMIFLQGTLLKVENAHKIMLVCGAACIASALVYSILLFCGIPVDASYSTIAEHIWVAGAMCVGGIIILLAGKKVSQKALEK